MSIYHLTFSDDHLWCLILHGKHAKKLEKLKYTRIQCSRFSNGRNKKLPCCSHQPVCKNTLELRVFPRNFGNEITNGKTNFLQSVITTHFLSPNLIF